jgi:transcriptional regulator with XRE-family HTH domain
MPNATARNLKNLLEKNKITSSQLSSASGIDKPIISRLLSGKTTNPQVETLKPIAEYFGVSIDQLIGVSPLPYEAVHGIVISIKRLMVPIIEWNNVPYWHEVRERFAPQATIDVSPNIAQDAYGLIILDHKFEPRIALGTTIIIEPSGRPNNRDYVLTMETDSAKNEKYAGLTIKQYITEKNKKFLKNIGHPFEMTPIKSNYNCYGVIVEAFFNLQKNL